MEASKLLIEKLKEFEGLRLEAYKDAAGVLTIGYGHTGSDVLAGDRITEYYAKELLMDDLGRFEAAVRQLHVAHTQGQFDALVSFAFNLGIGWLRGSTLLKTIREGSRANSNGGCMPADRSCADWSVGANGRLRGFLNNK